MHVEAALRHAVAPRPQSEEWVRVHAPARLHLGFLDPAGSLGRPFGSLGLVVDGLETVVDLGRAATDRFTCAPGDEAALARAATCLKALRAATGHRAPVALHLRHSLPAHAGLGSGTQMALAVGRAFCTLFDLPLASPQLAALLGRGARSGVGIAGFDQGGLLLDGGPRADGAPACLLARVAVPADWRILLVLDPRTQGLSGAAEKAALARLAPLPRAAAAEICHEVLMRVLPGAAGAEFGPFAAGVSRVQQVLGAHFAAAQDGRAFSSEAVGRLVRWVAGQAEAGIGQSSWGPAGFAVLRSARAAQEVLAAARSAGLLDPALQVLLVGARNHGALLTDTRPGE